jgi:hypothetical protein
MLAEGQRCGAVSSVWGEAPHQIDRTSGVPQHRKSGCVVMQIRLTYKNGIKIHKKQYIANMH